MGPAHAATAAQLELVSHIGWGAMVKKLRSLIRDAISRSGKKRDATPLTETELEYIYQHHPINLMRGTERIGK